MQYKLALLGFGNVGRNLAELLIRKQAELKERYDVTFIVTGVGTGRHGYALNPAGLDLPGVIEAIKAGKPLSEFSTRPISNSLEFIKQSGADVLFENTPVNHITGQPAIDHIKAGLELGMHVATANKGTVVNGYRELTALAKSKGRKFLFESTVMDGAPIFSLFRSALPGAYLNSFKGILNSTTNLILTRMEDGDTFDAAVRYAQQIGIAETDPSGDVDGWDAAIKVAALVTVLMDTPFKVEDVEREGIRGITPKMIASARAQHKRYKLVCSAERVEGGVKARVAPDLISNGSPIYGIDGTTSIIEFKTDVLGDLSLVESNPGPHTTAYGLLADFLNTVIN
jgi:homoserine dehydrogenase